MAMLLRSSRLFVQDIQNNVSKDNLTKVSQFKYNVWLIHARVYFIRRVFCYFFVHGL